VPGDYAPIRHSGPGAAEAEEAQEVQTVVPIPGLTDQEFRELTESVLVVIAHRAWEGIAAGLCQNFGIWGRIGLNWATIRDPNGGFLEVTRGGMVQFFLELAHKHPSFRYMVMVDNDESISWDAPLRLAQHGMPVVSGVVCGYSPERGIFACFTAKDENGVARFPSFRDTKILPSEGLIEAEQVGTGLLCIRRDVVETLREHNEEPFFIPEEYRLEGVRAGQLRKSEDIAFSERCAKFGFKRYVDLSIHAAHHKMITISWPTDHIDDAVKAIDWKPSPFDYKGVL
jgi:hypothetical protein